MKLLRINIQENKELENKIYKFEYLNKILLNSKTGSRIYSLNPQNY